MAGWLEQLEGLGGSVLDAASEGISARIKSELNPDAPRDPVNRPETQYDTNVTQPLDGPESKRTQGGTPGIGEIWSQYRWWIAGGLLITGYLAVRGSR